MAEEWHESSQEHNYNFMCAENGIPFDANEKNPIKKRSKYMKSTLSDRFCLELTSYQWMMLQLSQMCLAERIADHSIICFSRKLKKMLHDLAAKVLYPEITNPDLVFRFMMKGLQISPNCPQTR